MERRTHEEKFKEVAEAYSILSDFQKKITYYDKRGMAFSIGHAFWDTKGKTAEANELNKKYFKNHTKDYLYEYAVGYEI